jgi:PAP2 superfamily C-terminal
VRDNLRLLCGVAARVLCQLSASKSALNLRLLLQNRIAKGMAWFLAAVLAVLIICSRKHYTVDITVAWYTVPLVFLALERLYTTKRNDADSIKWTELEAVVIDRRPSGAMGSSGLGGESHSPSRSRDEGDPGQCHATATSRNESGQYFDGACCFAGQA